MNETILLFGLNISLYYVFWLLGMLAVVAGGCFLGKCFRFQYSRSVLYVVGAVAIGYLLLWVTSWIFNGGNVGGLNFVRVVTFMPIPILLLVWIFGDSYRDVADFLAPLVAIFHGVSHIGCIFPGCCHGYPAEWGLYSNEAGAFCFPIQLIEAVSSILIGVGLLLMMKKKVQPGKLYAWYLALFGGTRFVWEFFRDNEKIWNGISELAFHALAAMVIGIVAIVVLNKLPGKAAKA